MSMVVNLDHKIEEFDNYLKFNSRVILSAKFGDGKTTFLQKFEKKYKDDSFIITLHPVNYSVSKNEDIFEYIKYDILFELSKSNLVNDIDTETIWNLVKESVLTLSNLSKTVDFCLDLIPASRPLKAIKKRIEEIVKDKKLTEKYKEYQSNATLFDKYQKIFKSQIGGIYEQDNYTLLIKAILQSIEKRTILVIEDMDRIDPAHLFRILNILTAHINEKDSDNKFGFKNIVLVMDYDTTKHIFCHFYGDKADYEGYMSKFIQHGVFYYSIKEEFQNHFRNFLISDCKLPEDLNIPSSKDQLNTPLYYIIKELSIRDIIQSLDGIDDKIEIARFISDHNFDVSQPISRLLCALNSLNGRIDMDKVLNHLATRDEIIQILGEFLYVEPQIKLGNQFVFNHKYWTKSNITNVGEPMFKSSNTGIDLKIETKKVIDKAISAARKCLSI